MPYTPRVHTVLGLACNNLTINQSFFPLTFLYPVPMVASDSYSSLASAAVTNVLYIMRCFLANHCSGEVIISLVIWVPVTFLSAQPVSSLLNLSLPVESFTGISVSTMMPALNSTLITLLRDAWTRHASSEGLQTYQFRTTQPTPKWNQPWHALIFFLFFIHPLFFSHWHQCIFFAQLELMEVIRPHQRVTKRHFIA